ncbi:head-tail adaptor protein [Peribacillus sp. SCS-26]|uniref:phage head completion protein n=1 Tax=Paraperibacillus marinus TaxID=3115295 RepID=UPI003905934D
MIRFEYRKPLVKSGDLRTPVTFYEYAANDGPEPGESESRTLHKAWAKVDSVWMKDMEQAKSNGTLSDVTIIIRDPQADYIPGNGHYLSIDDPQYQDKRYNIKHVQPDFNRQFITIVAGLES